MLVWLPAFRRCKLGASSEFLAERIHRANLRLRHALDVNVLREADVAVAQNALDCLIVHAELVEVRAESAAESVPAVPLGQGIVALEYVAFAFVFFLGLLANRAARKRRLNHSIHEIVHVQRLRPKMRVLILPRRISEGRVQEARCSWSLAGCLSAAACIWA